MDTHVNASVSEAGGVHDENGHYATLLYTGCETRERAQEIEDGLYRAGRRLGFSISAKIVKASDGTFSVEYKAINKTHAKKYMLTKYGSDRSKWPYSPKKGDPNYG